MIEHSDWPLKPSATKTPIPSLIATLLSTSLSSTVLHLSLHPIALINHLARIYAVNVDPLDVRIYDFLRRLHARGWGGYGYIREEDADGEEGAVSMDALGDGRYGRCVVQWNSRGLTGRAVVDRGLEGVKLILNAELAARIALVPLVNVLDSKPTSGRPAVAVEPVKVGASR